MNKIDNIEIIEQGARIDCQQRVVDTLQADTATLESIYQHLELSVTQGGLDQSSKDIVQVTLDHALVKYGQESISLESTTSGIEDAQISMEKIGGKLKEFGGAVKRGLVKLWQSIVKFFKWIGSLFSRKKATIIKESEQIKKFEAVITEAAKNLDNTSNDPDAPKASDPLNVVIQGLPKLSDMTSIASGPDASPAPTDESQGARATQMPKTVVSAIAREIASENTNRRVVLEYGSLFSEDGKPNDSSVRVLTRGSVSGYQTVYLMDDVSDILGNLLAALDKYHKQPELKAYGQDGKLASDISAIAKDIYALATSEKLNPAKSSTMPGLVLTHDLKRPEEYQGSSMREFLSPTGFKFIFTPPTRSPLEVPLLSTKQIAKYNNTCLEILDLKRRHSKTYDRYLKLDVSKYMVDGMSAEVSWCLNWIVKLTSAVMMSERYTTHCDKCMSFLKRDSLRALGK